MIKLKHSMKTITIVTTAGNSIHLQSLLKMSSFKINKIYYEVTNLLTTLGIQSRVQVW